MSDWKKTTLGELSYLNKGFYGAPLPAVFDEKSILPKYLRITDILGDGTIKHKNLMSVEINKNNEFWLKENDIVFARTGASLGKNYFYNKSDGNMIFAGFLIKFSLLTEKCFPLFVKYCFMTDEYKNFIKGQDTGGTRGNMSAKQFASYSFNIPSIEEQGAIAGVLSSFDDKIELNNKMIENLETQAQALYKKLIIKEEFNLVSILDENVCKILKPGIEKFEDKKVYIATADVTDSEIVNNKEFIDFFNKPSRASMQPVEYSLWFAKMKNSRKLIFINNFNINEYKDYIFSTGFMGIKSSSQMFYYLWCFLSSKEFDKIKNNLCNGTTMEAININTFSKIKIKKFSNDILIAFNKNIEKLFNSIQEKTIENQKLAEMRDYLLPKLMSGKIRVKY